MKRRILLFIYNTFSYILFDPLAKVRQYKALPHFINNYVKFKRLHLGNNSFPLRWTDFYVTTADKFLSAGSAKGHYFFQDIWAATAIYQSNTREHVDVGSRIDGFIGHILPFCKVDYVDIRPLDSNIDGLTFVQGSILDLPYATDSVHSLSCLHVIEHIGLGRYGDPIDPDGAKKSAHELSRVLAPNGTLYIGTPVGRQRICYDAHRVFHPQTIVQMFGGLTLKSFHLIDDKGAKIIENADFEQAAACHYGCGLFIFEK